MSNRKELEFTAILEELKELAGEQGNCVSRQQVNEAFSAFGLSEEQYLLVTEYLKKNHIGIGTPVDPDSYLSSAEKNYLAEYISELNELPKVPAGVKEAITLSAMAGDADAQAKLIEIYLPYVVDVAKLYTGYEVSLEDLIGEGNVALTAGVTMLGCLEHAAEAEGMLGKIMMDAMETLIAENGRLKKEDDVLVQKVNQVASLARELAADFRRKVTVAELVQESSLSEEEIKDAISMSGYAIEDIEQGMETN